MHMIIYIYLRIMRDRQRERFRENIYIYIYIYLQNHLIFLKMSYRFIRISFESMEKLPKGLFPSTFDHID